MDARMLRGWKLEEAMRARGLVISGDRRTHAETVRRLGEALDEVAPAPPPPDDECCGVEPASPPLFADEAPDPKTRFLLRVLEERVARLEAMAPRRGGAWIGVGEG